VSEKKFKNSNVLIFGEFLAHESSAANSAIGYGLGLYLVQRVEHSDFPSTTWMGRGDCL